MKVLLVDDHPLILSALKSVIKGLGEHVNVVGVSTARAARESLSFDRDFDLVLLDLQLGDTDGFELLKEFRGSYPALPVVVVSASDRASDVIRAIDLGAMGFVPKRASNETLCDALQMVMSGGIYVPPMNIGEGRPSAPAQAALDGPLNLAHHREAARHQAHGSLASLGLTPRQTDVLALLLKGHPNKLIARELGVSVETVKDHVAAVLRALKVSSRTQAVRAVGQINQQQRDVPAWRGNAR